MFDIPVTIQNDKNTPAAEISIDISPSAEIRIVELMEGRINQILRIEVRSGGCAGFRYSFSFEEQIIGFNDLLIQEGDAFFVIDNESATLINGSTIDYESSLMESRFTIKNPSATSTCGCGESFSS